MLNYYDRGSDFIWSDPVKAKDEPSTTRSFSFLMGPDVNVRLVYSDDHSTLNATCRKLGILRRASQPGDPQSNGMIESMNRRIIEGGRTALQQAGLPNCFWPYACTHWCTMRNTFEKEDQMSPYVVKHGDPFDGLRLISGWGVFPKQAKPWGFYLAFTIQIHGPLVTAFSQTHSHTLSQTLS